MRLEQHLDTQNLSIAGFAQMVERTQECVRLWLRGQRMPGTGDIAKIESATDGAVTANDLHAACVAYQQSKQNDSHPPDMGSVAAPVTETVHG